MSEHDYKTEAYVLGHECISSRVNFHDAVRHIASALRAAERRGVERGGIEAVARLREMVLYNPTGYRHRQSFLLNAADALEAEIREAAGKAEKP